MELGYKPRIFTFLTIWQDIAKPSKMLSDGFVCVLGGGGGAVTGSLSLLLSSNANIVPPSLGQLQISTNFQMLDSTGAQAVRIWEVCQSQRSQCHLAVLRGGRWVVESAADPCPGLLRTAVSSLSLYSSSRGLLCLSLLPPFPWITPFLLAFFFFCIVLW